MLQVTTEHLSGHARAQLLGALGVKGNETELRSAGDEFRGHCLALTLLGSLVETHVEGQSLSAGLIRRQ